MSASPLAELSTVLRSQFRVGGVSVEVAGANAADVTLVPSLLPFRVETSDSDINIQVERVPSLPLRPGRKLFDSGSVWQLYEDQGRFQFDFSTRLFGESPYKRLIVDRDFRRASLLLRIKCFGNTDQAAAPLDYPLDEVLITHRLAFEEGIELHGCGVVAPDDAGNLFVGHSGAGKSTTAQLWAEHPGVEILSDDRIIVRKNHSALNNNGGGDMRMYGTPWHGEAGFASPNSARLSRIFVLEHGRGNVVTRFSPGQAVGELFARSFVPFHRHGFVESALKFLQDLVDKVPCYWYAFEPDQGAVERILEFRD